MFQKTTLILLLLVIVSCKNKNEKGNEKITKANWLLGKWETKTADGNLSESWKQVNDSTFQGLSFFIKDKDTLHNESIILQQNGEDLIYNATIQGQNENKAVSFKMISGNEKQMVFENPKHDYPQKITYTLITKDSLVAAISGIQLGKPSSEKFGMKKTE
jgi:hypothetical protein